MSQEGSARHIFPFLDLPRELQVLIYKKYYEDNEIILDLKNVSIFPPNGLPVIRGTPNPNVEFLNHEIRQDARRYRSEYLSRSLTINRPILQPQTINNSRFKTRYSWVCNHIEEVSITAETTVQGVRMAWSSLLEVFPNMKKICLRRFLSGRWIGRAHYENAVRDATESYCTQTLPRVMQREFRTQLLLDALAVAGRDVEIAVFCHWSRTLTDTDETLTLVSWTEHLESEIIVLITSVV